MAELDSVQAYCLKCRAKVTMLDPQPVLSEAGASGVRGKCPQCGSSVYKPVGGRRPKANPEDAAARAKAKTKAKSTGRAKTGARTGPKTAGRRAATADASTHGRNLVIVESPAKARTIQRYLGQDFVVRASIGHVRDLLRSRMSVDVDNDFEPTYRVPNDKKAIVKELKAAAASAPLVFLATDPDREGEAIAWHLVAATDLEGDRARRVVFHEITRDAIESAFSHPRGIDMNLVDAQQARRVLDRLVGYRLSPLLWQKVRSRLSAGRVQSVAVRLVVEREREIAAFVPEEYWTIDAMLRRAADDGDAFRARLQRVNGEDAEITGRERAEAITGELRRSTYTVAGVKRGTKKRSPSPPFITSTLQQEAARVLGFQAARTMRIAQQLYEGVDIGPEGSTGLITYMRTDSVNVAESALAEVRQYVRGRYGEQYLPEQPVRYRTRSKMAQEAHEAVRPTSVLRAPDDIAGHLTKEQYSLYYLIWRRFVASQMQPALYDTVTVDVAATPDTGENVYGLRANGSHLSFPGFLVVYGDRADKDGETLPPLEEADVLRLLKLTPEQHFTEPPPRYTEASLIRELESKGIGRPSTYAAIISTIISRGYVERDRRTLLPTETAFVVNDLLVAQFPDVMDVGFTAQMEDRLDDVAAGKKQWVPVVADFYGPFDEHLQRASVELEPAQMQDEPAGIDCDRCGAPMVVKYGRFGKFIGCSRYPECKNTKPFLIKTGVPCPECGSGEIVERRSRKGRRFYGCDRYPECRFASFTQPVAQRCDKCGAQMVRSGRDRARCTACKATAPLRDDAMTPEAVAGRG